MRSSVSRLGTFIPIPNIMRREQVHNCGKPASAGSRTPLYPHFEWILIVPGCQPAVNSYD